MLDRAHNNKCINSVAHTRYAIEEGANQEEEQEKEEEE